MYKRTEYQVITSRLKEPRKFIQVVMGPRQVGKSTVVKQVLQDLNLPYQQFSADNVPASNTAWVSNCWAAVRRSQGRFSNLFARLIAYNLLPKKPAMNLEIIDRSRLIA